MKMKLKKIYIQSICGISIDMYFDSFCTINDIRQVKIIILQLYFIMLV